MVKAKDRYDLIRFDSSGAVSANMFDESWRRFVIKMATGSGKTKVMSLILAWCYFHKFYEEGSELEKGLRSGLPYRADGTPVASDGIDYKKFVKMFRDQHRLNTNPSAREVCVLRGGPLEKPVHSNGCFDDWFHPYHRHANGSLNLDYILKGMKVECKANQPVDQPQVTNLDGLLNLSSRWTREFKAEYAKHQKILIQREERRIRDCQNRYTQVEVQNYIQEWKDDLLSSEPHHEVHSLLSDALLEPSRLNSWATELSDL